MKKLYVAVDYSIKIEGVQGYTGDIEVDDDDSENFEKLSSFMGEMYMTQKQADKVEDIFAESGSMIEALDKLEKAGIIQDYEVKEEED